jgi:hypothetical protein
MKRSILLSVLWLVFPLASHAEIYKCAVEDSTVYQDVPCNDRNDDTTVTYGNTLSRPEPINASPEVSIQKSSASVPLAHPAISLGMTDDEVLNLPGWGRPQKIKRSKSENIWSEHWSYNSYDNDHRHLQFANGKLMTIDIEPREIEPREVKPVTLR